MPPKKKGELETDGEISPRIIEALNSLTAAVGAISVRVEESNVKFSSEMAELRELTQPRRDPEQKDAPHSETLQQRLRAAPNANLPWREEVTDDTDVFANYRRQTAVQSDLVKLMQSKGLIEEDDEDSRLVQSIIASLKKKGEKDQKLKQQVYPTFGKFYSKMVDMKVLSGRFADDKPDEFWAMHTHFMIVLGVMAEYDWPTAADYHCRVMKAWGLGGVDLVDSAKRSEVRNGYWEAATEGAPLAKALSARDARLRSEQAYSSSKRFPGWGTRRNQEDTYCEFHSKFYPLEANHSSETCQHKK